MKRCNRDELQHPLAEREGIRHIGEREGGRLFLRNHPVP